LSANLNASTISQLYAFPHFLSGGESFSKY
jgi:hypothetical protein